MVGAQPQLAAMYGRPGAGRGPAPPPPTYSDSQRQLGAAAGGDGDQVAPSRKRKKSNSKKVRVSRMLYNMVLCVGNYIFEPMHRTGPQCFLLLKKNIF